MQDFNSIIEQEAMKEHLWNAITNGQVSHAYIINGEKNSGKKFISGIFAAALQCEENHTVEHIEANYLEENSKISYGSLPCGKCHSCKQWETRNNPDIILVGHDKPNSIGVDDIRNKVNNDISIKPYSRPFKVYIIDEAEKMTAQAQNALLKTLEEPPYYGIIILLTTNMEAFLPTIVSRCVVLNMKPISDEGVKDYLMKEQRIPDYKADVCVAFARGNLGKAKALASSEEFDEIKADAVSLMKTIDDLDTSGLVTAVKKIAEDKSRINEYFDIMTVWYRDVLLFKATNDINYLIFRDEIQYIRKVAMKRSYEDIENTIAGIAKAKRRLEANVNFDLTMQLLFMTMKDNE